jgi:hypothetical protein
MKKENAVNTGKIVVELTKMERDAIMNALAYMVEGGLTSFPLAVFRTAYNKLKDVDDPPFPEPETEE